MAEEIMEEGNKELQICLQKKPLSRGKFQRAESKIEMGSITGSRNLAVNQKEKKIISIR